MPHKYQDEALISSIMERIEAGVAADVAASACGLSRRAWYVWREKAAAGIEPYTEIMQRAEEARDRFESNAVLDLRHGCHACGETIDAKQKKSIEWLLERSRRERWGAKIEIHQVRDDAIRYILGRLRQGTDPEVYRAIVEQLADEHSPLGVGEAVDPAELN